MSKSKPISYGNFETSEEEFQPKNVKVRITTMLDLDILKYLKSVSKKKNIGYQTLMNEALRRFMDSTLPPKTTLSDHEIHKIAEKVAEKLHSKRKRD